MKILTYSDNTGFTRQLEAFCAKGQVASNVSTVVSRVLSDVREKGDFAVLEYTKKFDRARLKAKDLRVTAEELKAAEATLSAADRSAIRQAIREVKAFHKQTLPKNWSATNGQGGRVGERFYPIERVGLYIPGVMPPSLNRCHDCRLVKTCRLSSDSSVHAPRCQWSHCPRHVSDTVFDRY